MIYSLKVFPFIFDDNISWSKHLEIMAVYLSKLTDLSK